MWAEMASVSMGGVAVVQPSHQRSTEGCCIRGGSEVVEGALDHLHVMIAAHSHNTRNNPTLEDSMG